MASLKGQNFRVFVGGAVVGSSTSCQITLGTQTDDTTTKDDVNLATKSEVTAKNFQVQVESLDVSDVGTLLTAIKNATPFTLVWDETSTDDNVTAEEAAFARTGQAFLTDLSLTFNDREYSAKSLQFTGTGAISALTSTQTPSNNG